MQKLGQVVMLKQSVLIEGKYRVEPLKEGVYLSGSVRRKLELEPHARVATAHLVEHASQDRNQEIVLIRLGSQYGDGVFVIAVRVLVAPELGPDYLIEGWIGEQVFENLISKPATPIPAEAGACQEMICHGICPELKASPISPFRCA
jgi:hypothetical protein